METMKDVRAAWTLAKQTIGSIREVRGVELGPEYLRVWSDVGMVEVTPGFPSLTEPVGVDARLFDAALKIGGAGDKARATVENGTVTIGAASVPTVEVEVPEYPVMGRECFGKYRGPDVTGVAGFADTSDIRPVLGGVSFRRDRIAATDSYRLAVTDTPGEGPEDDVTIPARPLAALGKRCDWLAVSKDDAYCRASGVIKATGALIIWTGRVIEGHFPKYDQLFPDSWEVAATLADDAGKVIGNYRKALDKGAPIRLSLNGNIEVRCDGEVGVAPAPIAPVVEWGGDGVAPSEPVEIGANAKFLESAVKYAGEGATFRAISPLRPMLIENGYRRALVMPLRLGD